MKLERVLVTGGAGFLGSHLCERLLAEGCEVIVFDNLLTGRMDNIAHLLADSRFSFEHYDVTNHLYVAGRLDAILHFASPASPADFERLPIEILKVGALGTHKALGLARAKNARFLLASTTPEIRLERIPRADLARKLPPTTHRVSDGERAEILIRRRDGIWRRDRR